MNRDDFRKALDSQREIYTKRSPLPPWARKAVTHTTIFAFVCIVAALGLVALGFAYMAIQIILYILQ